MSYRDVHSVLEKRLLAQLSNPTQLDPPTPTQDPYTCVPSLILSSISSAPKTFAIKEVGRSCLAQLKQCSSARYAYLILQPSKYPPDLDDTSVALLAIWDWDHSLKSDTLKQYIQDLYHLEKSEGGPYRTWILNNTDPHWKDVDPVVNINIGRLLCALSILPKQLDEYLLETWNGDASSKYYPNPILPLYFLSDLVQRKRGIGKLENWTETAQKIRSTIEKELAQTDSIDEQIVLLTSLVKLGAQTKQQVASLQQCCLDLCTAQSTGITICLDQQHQTNKTILRSPAVTTAIAIEGLTILELNQARKRYLATKQSLHSDASRILQAKLNDWPEPISTTAHQVVKDFLVEKNHTVWNLAEGCEDLDIVRGTSRYETVLSVHLEGWIHGTLLNNFIGKEVKTQVFTAQTIGPEILTLLYLWNSVLKHLTSLSRLQPDLQYILESLPDKTLGAWIREHAGTSQFREERAAGHILLFLVLSPTAVRKHRSRLFQIVLEASHCSDTLRDLKIDGPELSESDEQQERKLLVQRLQQLYQTFSDLAQFELPFLRFYLKSTHHRAKLDILLTDVIRRTSLQAGGGQQYSG